MKPVTKRQEVIARQAANPIYYSIDFSANSDSICKENRSSCDILTWVRDLTPSSKEKIDLSKKFRVKKRGSCPSVFLRFLLHDSVKMGSLMEETAFTFRV